MSVIFLGIPLERTGTVGAVLFFRLLAASTDFCISSARNAADFGLRFNVKCFATEGYKMIIVCTLLNNNKHAVTLGTRSAQSGKMAFALLFLFQSNKHFCNLQ